MITGPDVEIVVPVYNEETTVVDQICKLHDYLNEKSPLRWRITIVDNASTDGTWGKLDFFSTYGAIRIMRLPQKGRGRAIRTAWEASQAKVVAYTDLDLSADLSALMPLVSPLLDSSSDIGIGTRWHHDAKVQRSVKRQVVSWSYNHLLQKTLGVHFSDAMCGFKAMRTDVAKVLLPDVEDNEWFFDTELLVLAERLGFSIHEVPLNWIDDPNSSVHIARTALANLRGIRRITKQPRSFSEGRLHK